MIIIELTPLENGAHRNQTTSGRLPVPDGWVAVPEWMEIPKTFPFVEIKAEDGVVVNMTAGTAPDPEPEPPTTDERVEKLESENKLLREQVSAQADQAEFYEECIAEMAAIVYA